MTASAAQRAARATRKMTATWCQQLATKSRRDFTDGGCTGLQLRVSPSSKTWLFRYKLGAEWVRLTLGPYSHDRMEGALTLAEARAEVGKLSKHLAAGIDPRKARAAVGRARAKPEPAAASVAASDPDSFDALVADFLARVVDARHKRPAYTRRLIEVEILPVWRGRAAATIEPDEVVAVTDAIMARGSPAIANRVRAVIGQIYRHALGRGRKGLTNPVRELDAPAGARVSRSRVLSRDELAALIPALPTTFPQPIGDLLLILLLTGQRRGELAAAKWSNVDLSGDAPTWTVPAEDSKTGEPSIVPLAPWTVEAFKRVRKAAKKSAYVYPRRDGSAATDPKVLTRAVFRKLATMRKKLAIKEPWTVHDLRRTCRTGLAMLKVPPHVAERVLNHKQRGIVAVYDRFAYQDEKRDALNKWADELRKIATPKESAP